MAIKWINKHKENGTATITSNYIMINKLFSDKFNHSYEAMLGVDECDNIVLKPLSLDEVESAKYQNSVLLKISPFSTYTRIGNASNMKRIEDIVNIKFDKAGKKFITEWDEQENALKILVKEEKL